jgi:hypothetical protein
VNFIFCLLFSSSRMVQTWLMNFVLR